MDRCPAQQVDDWNRRMAPMVDVVLTMADGRDLPGTLDGQAYLSADAAFVRVRRPTGWRPATFVADLSRVRPMTDADRARFGIGKAPRTLFACRSCGGQVGDGEQDNGGCPHCGRWSLDPIGHCDDEARS